VEIITNKKKHTEVIILGDFNHTVDNILDRLHPQTTGYKKLPVFNWLKRQDFTDSFRSLHPTERAYTWSNQEAATRIDYIWLSETMAAGLQEANIEEAEGITGSDHRILTTVIWLEHVIANQSCAEIKRKDQMRTIYLYEEAKQEDWEEYAKELQVQLEWKKILKQLEEDREVNIHSTDTLDHMWNAIEEAITEAANKQIPKKKIFNTKVNRRKHQKKLQQNRNITELQQIIKKAKIRKNQEIEKEEKEEINNKLKNIGKEIGVTLPKLHKQWSEAWIDDIKGWQRILKDKRKEEWERALKKQIEENINKRCEMIKTDQGRMIASLLNKPYKKITLDRFMTQTEDEASLTTEPKAVLNGLAKHFEKQFRK
jgi:hypothetical protein